MAFRIQPKQMTMAGAKNIDTGTPQSKSKSATVSRSRQSQAILDLRNRKEFHLVLQSVHYDEMKGVDKLWLQHHAELLPRNNFSHQHQTLLNLKAYFIYLDLALESRLYTYRSLSIYTDINNLDLLLDLGLLNWMSPACIVSFVDLTSSSTGIDAGLDTC